MLARAPPIRHRRDRACRRARPRGARISRRHARRQSRVRDRGRLDRRRKPDDAPSRAEDGDDDRRILPRSRRFGPADRRFGHPLRPRRPRRRAGGRRAGGRPRLCAERFQRSAAAARARGTGRRRVGSITGVFSVLVDGDDHNDPVADSIRGTLDGHIVLDRAIADQGRYPAVNILSSMSRLAHPAWTPEQRKLVAKPALADRALRGDARSSPDGRLYDRRRSDPRQGDQIGAAHL